MTANERLKKWTRLASFAELVWAREKLEGQYAATMFPPAAAKIAGQLSIVNTELTARGIQHEELLAAFEPRQA